MDVQVKRKRAARPKRPLHILNKEKWDSKQKVPLVDDKVHDPIEHEISSAMAEGRPVDMSAAFPADGTNTYEETRKLEIRQKNLNGESDKLFNKVINEDGGEIIPDLPPEDETEREQLDRVTRHSPHLKKEYRLRILNRMILRGMSIDVIAATIGVCTNTVKRDRKILKERLRQEVSRFDTNLFLGRGFALYAEIIQTCMEMVAKSPSNQDRREAMRTAMQANMDSHRMAALWNIPQIKPYEGSNDDSNRQSGSGHDLVNMVRAAISGPSKVDEYIIDRQGGENDDDEENILL